MPGGAGDHRLRPGVLLMIAGMTALGLVPVGARFAYDGGASPEVVTLSWHLFTILLVALLLPRGGGGMLHGLVPPRRLLPPVAVMGVVFAVFSWAYIAALVYIPVSLAVLLLYTFPAQVVLMTALLRMERTPPLRLLGFALAFAGVALAVGAGAAAPDPRGVALGLTAAFGLALITVLAARLGDAPDRRATIFGFALVATALTFAATILGPGFSFPSTFPSWGGLVFAGGAAGLGVALYFVALPLLEPVRAALLSNLEPVVATLAAILILGERTDAARLAGIVLVLGAIALIRTSNRGALRLQGKLPDIEEK